VGDTELSPDIERLAKKLEKDPSSRVFAQLGDLYRKAKLYEEAIQVLTSGLKKNPNYALGHLVLAKTYLDQMRPAMAKEELERVIELDPQNMVALKLLAPILEKSGTDEELIRIYELILAINPADQATLDKLNEVKSRKRRTEEVPTGEFRVETFQQFQPPKEKGETMAEVQSDLVEQMRVEPLKREPTFKKDIAEEKLDVQPYVERPGADLKSSEDEPVEEELEIVRDTTFTPTEEPEPEEKIDTSIMGQLTGGKEVKGEEVVEEKVDLQSDLISQMGFESKKEQTEEVVEEKIDTDIMGQLTGEPTKKEEVSSIDDVLKVTPPENVPTVDEVLKTPEEKKEEEEEEEKKDNLQSFRDWLDSLTK